MQLAPIHDEVTAASRADGFQGPERGAEHGRSRQDDFQPHLVHLFVGHEVSGLRSKGEPVNAVADMLDVHEIGANRVVHDERLHHGVLVLLHSKAPRLDAAEGSFHQSLHKPASNLSASVDCTRVHGFQPVNPRPPVHDYGFTVRKAVMW